MVGCSSATHPRADCLFTFQCGLLVGVVSASVVHAVSGRRWAFRQTREGELLEQQPTLRLAAAGAELMVMMSRGAWLGDLQTVVRRCDPLSATLGGPRGYSSSGATSFFALH